MARKILMALAASFAVAGGAAAQVVADSACEKYAVDIAAFATCDSATRVARAEDDKVGRDAARVEDRAAAGVKTPDAEKGRDPEAPKPAARRLARPKAR